MVEDKVLILMATYNGANYVETQIESLLSQSYQNWELIIRDDGSNDETKEILTKYTQQLKQLKIIETIGNYHSACANFGYIFDWVKQNRSIEYLMFCDQDDIWLPNKIEDSLNQLKSLEIKHPKKACLIYGDLHIVDDEGIETNEIIQSFLTSPKNILIQNPMFGCTMMMNNSLVKLIDHIPHDAENHDYWVALVAVFFGVHDCSPDKRILYRQHSNNVTSQGKSILNRIKRYSSPQQVNEIKIKIKMLHLFYQAYKDILSIEQSKMLSKFLNSFKSSNPLRLVFTILKFGILRHTFMQNVGLFMVICGNYRVFKKENSKIVKSEFLKIL